MRSFLYERQIDRLYHFTQVDNLKNIFRYGLLPRDELERRRIDSLINDEYRYDNCLDAICTSIEFPNYKMFYKLRRENPDVDWAVLELNAEIICDYQCAFNWTNAGDSASYSIPIKKRMTQSAFENLFEDKDGYPTREELKIPDWYPTNPQAEVLVFNRIPISYINGVFFENKDKYLKYQEIIPTDIYATFNNNLFKWRKDYEFWKGRVEE